MIRSIVIASFVFGLVACAKVDDLGHLQEEGTATAKSYGPKLDELQHRADAALARGAEAARGSDPNETVRARALLDRATQLISELRSKASVASADIASTAKSGNFEDVERKIDELRHKMNHGIIEATADLEAVDSWLSQAEMQAKVTPATPEPGEPNEPTETAPEPASPPPTDAKQPAPKQPEPKQPAKQPARPKQG